MAKQPRRPNAYQKLEQRLLGNLPAVLASAITPLRFRILLGYLLLFLLAAYGWEQITSAWRYLLTLLAPAFAVIGALMALKLSVVAVSLFTLLVSLVKILFGFLVVVLKPGILKAIFIPQIVTFAGWVHDKSERLQRYVRGVYGAGKKRIERVINWWEAQSIIDKILLSGFIVPLLLIVLVVFVIKRALTIFAVKKLTEQIVQKSTKLFLKNFHKLPLIGGLPGLFATQTRKLTQKGDREDVMNDLKALGREFDPDDDEDEIKAGNDNLKTEIEK